MQGWGGSCRDGWDGHARVWWVGVGHVGWGGMGHAGIVWGESRHTTGYQILQNNNGNAGY